MFNTQSCRFKVTAVSAHKGRRNHNDPGHHFLKERDLCLDCLRDTTNRELTEKTFLWANLVTNILTTTFSCVLAACKHVDRV